MINRVTLTGRLTKDIELQKTTSGKSVCTFYVAVDRPYKKDDGTRDADFYQMQAWNQVAEYLASYGRKGSTVAIDGRLGTDAYERDGARIIKTFITCDNVQIFNRNDAYTSEMKSNDNSSTEMELPY